MFKYFIRNSDYLTVLVQFLFLATILYAELLIWKNILTICSFFIIHV